MRCSHIGQIGIALVFMASGSSMAQDRDVKVTGRVVDRDGKPVAGAKVARMWHASLGNKPDGFAPTVTGADGRFTLKVDFYGRDVALMVLDAGRTVGGTALVPATVGPLVRALRPATGRADRPL